MYSESGSWNRSLEKQVDEFVSMHSWLSPTCRNLDCVSHQTEIAPDQSHSSHWISNRCWISSSLCSSVMNFLLQGLTRRMHLSCRCPLGVSVILFDGIHRLWSLQTCDLWKPAWIDDHGLSHCMRKDAERRWKFYLNSQIEREKFLCRGVQRESLRI